MNKNIILLCLALYLQRVQLLQYCINKEQMDEQCSTYESLKQSQGINLPKQIQKKDGQTLSKSTQILFKYLLYFQSLQRVLRKQKINCHFTLIKISLMSFKQSLSQLMQNLLHNRNILSQMYEVLGVIGCTSIIARNPDGSIVHGRNLDYAFSELISPLLASIEFQRNGKTVFDADMVLGTAIVVTGVVLNGFSITINQRKETIDPMQYLKNQYIPACYLIDQILQTKTQYQDALNALLNTKIAIAAYLNIAGISGNEGSVIERDREDVNLQTKLSESTWFICQTNNERQQADPQEDCRRISNEQKNRKNQTKINGLLQKCLTFYLKTNFDVPTITTDIMIPQKGYINSTKWFNPPISIQTVKSYQLILQTSVTLLTILIL